MEFKFSDRMLPLTGSATREILKFLSRPEIISFAGGFPATQCLPSKDIENIAADLLKNQSVKVLQYGATEGFPELREECIKYVSDMGVKANMDETLVISGGQQGIDLLSKAFLNKGDVVLVENPTYLTALQIFATYEAKIVGVESTPYGLDIDDLKQKIKKYNPKLLYIVPTFANPTGKTFTVENRKEIAEATANGNVVVIEDDPYSRLRFSGEAVPSLKSFDKGENIVYVTSFSKVCSPGLRVGAAFGNKNIIRKMAIGKQGSDVTTSNLSQLIVAEYLKRGYLQPNIEKGKPIYRERKNAMIEAIKKYMPEEYEYNDPDGGLFIWGKINADIDMVSMLPKAIENNVAYIHGSCFFADGGHLNTFRLNYSNADPEKIDIGIKALAKTIKNELKK